MDREQRPPVWSPLAMDEATLLSDEDLIAAIRRDGDPASLEQLIQRHLPQVRSTAFQMTCDDTAADDVTQEVFLRAIRGLAGFDGRAKFSTWLFRISKNPRKRICSDNRARAAHARLKRPITPRSSVHQIVSC